MKKASFKAKLSLLLILSLLVAAVMVGCGENAADVTADAVVTTEAPNGRELVGEGKYSFNFSAVFADGTAKLYEVSTDAETVGEALLALGLIDGEEGAYGLYVKSVCSVVADYNVDQTYWALYTDGEMSMVGADSVKCADVSLVEFKVEK